MNCRHCHTLLRQPFLDLGTAPPSNAYLSAENLQAPEQWLPLRVMVCENCWLVQTEDFSRPAQLFPADYAYFSSFSVSWLEHARHYVDAMRRRFGLNAQSMVVEIAANDGYLLQYVQQAGIPCLGVEPTAGTAQSARAKGIAIVEEFFGERTALNLAKQGYAADLTTANNVLAHVPDINDFVRGFTILLKPQGVATFEFPHLLRLVEENQFDTVYHEHYSYLSLTAVNTIFASQGLHIFDVENLTTHGGSLRVYAQRADLGRHQPTDQVAILLNIEKLAGIMEKSFYTTMQVKAEQIKNALLTFLLTSRREGVSIAAYGAAAKGNTLLNFAGVRPDLLPFVVDRNPAKQGKFLPGSRIPIVDEAHLRSARPNRVLILPWNLREEIAQQLDYIHTWQGRFVTAVPCLSLF